MVIIENTSPQLTAEECQSILDLDRHVRATHGREGLVEQARFALLAGDPAIHLLSYDAERLTGYAQVTLADRDATVEFLGSNPSTELVDAAVGVARRAGRSPALWLHGLDESAPSPFGPGFEVDRRLFRLQRATRSATSPALPVGFSLRSFGMGRDAEAWLSLNRRAFAKLPDQGSWDSHDLQQRVEAPWFDPDGFLLLEHGSKMVGFCWTKVHDEGPSAFGEIYVIGVDPDQEGRGLGRFLVEAGIALLASRGIEDVILYVEADNLAARRLYDRLGFHVMWVDEQSVLIN